MANHLTPEEMADEYKMPREKILELCVEHGVPVYHGKIDQYLFGLHVPKPLAEPQLVSAAS